MARLSDFISQDDIDDAIENSGEVLRAKLDLANDAADYARSIAPVDSGDYRDGIKVQRHGKSGVGIHFTSEISNLIEYGSVHNEEFAIRAKTAARFGGRGNRG